MTVTCRLAGPDDAGLFRRVAEGVFDRAIEPRLLTEFLSDPRHHMAVADDGGVIVGFVSAVDYVHPDKPRQLWVNEVGVASAHRRGGIGRQLLQLMIEHGRALGCTEAWVLTDSDNEAANSLYRSAGARDPQPQLLYCYRLS